MGKVTENLPSEVSLSAFLATFIQIYHFEVLLQIALVIKKQISNVEAVRVLLVETWQRGKGPVSVDCFSTGE